MKSINPILLLVVLLLTVGINISCQEDKKKTQVSNKNQANDTANFLKQTGVKAIMKADGKTIFLTYDHRTKAMKISGGNIPSDSYMDTKGNMYVNVPQQGWVKMNPGKMVMAGQLMGNMMGLPGFTQSSNIEELQNNRFGPIVDWPLRMTPETLSENQEFEKGKADCLDGNGKCIEFTGTSGESKGVRLLFDKQEKLRQLSYEDSIINYEYDTYNVQLPEAKEFSYGK